jgi:hypothetical protein
MYGAPLIGRAPITPAQRAARKSREQATGAFAQSLQHGGFNTASLQRHITPGTI